MTRPAVLVFARQYDRGPVKTRLAAELGAESARQVYRRLAELIWRGLEHEELERWLWIEPADAMEEAAAWLPGAARVRGQASGDLGERMAAAFAAAFHAGAPWAAAVGTDAPDVGAAEVMRAGEALRKADLALIPSLDGGYALIAMRELHAELFRDMAWSSATVADATRARAAQLDLTVAELEAVRDLDTKEDYDALRRRFAMLAAPGP